MFLNMAKKDTKAEDKPNQRGGTGFIIVLVLVALLTQPAAVVAFAVFVTIGELRRVRMSRWLLWTGIALAASLLASGLNVGKWASWWLAGTALTVGGWLPNPAPVPAAQALVDIHSLGGAVVLREHLLVALPTALGAMCIYWVFRSYALALRGQMEGKAWSNMRPVGWLDNLAGRRNTTALKTGQWSNRHSDQVAVGIGTYGKVAADGLDSFKKAVAVFGTSRSGKTRLANSLAAQQVMSLGCGNIVLDFKGDDAMAAAKAELAQQRGVPFLHFKLLSRTGGGYRPPHPYAPVQPAHYDPLRRGNGSSKAAMLLGSVPRDGDAAVYERMASEAVKLAYDIAALTGFDKATTGAGAPISGLAVIAQMLDQTTLITQGKAVTAEQVLAAHPFLSRSAADAKVATIHARIATFEKELSRRGSPLSGALEDTRSTVASYVNDSVAGLFLTPGTVPALRIDLVRAILRNEIVVFSLPAQEYPEMAAMVGTMVLLDLQNAVATLRDNIRSVTDMLADSDTPIRPDGTPWNPLVLQIEELGSIRSTAAAAALLGLLNKSADVGIRAVISSQAFADLEAVDDGRGVWLRQIIAQVGNLFSFQLSESQDAEKVAHFSGVVEKRITSEAKAVENNRLGLFQGAGQTEQVMARGEECTRIGAGEALQLNIAAGELFWVSKTPALTAVHTTAPEGPNNWSEKIRLQPVWEQPYQWDPFADSERAATAAEVRTEVFTALVQDLKRNKVLRNVCEGKQDAIAVEADVQHPAVLPTPEAEQDVPLTALTATPVPDGTVDTDAALDVSVDADAGLADSAAAAPTVAADDDFADPFDDDSDPFA